MSTAHVRSPAKDIDVQLSKDVRVRHAELGRYCWSPLEPHHEDLLNLAGVIAFADRAIHRTPARTGWARDIHVIMPVADPGYWLRPGVVPALIECLGYVTGDRWTFKFIKGRKPSQLPLALARPKLDAVVPFSGGLDSYLLRSEIESRDETPLLVTTRTSSLVRRIADDAARGAVAGAPIIAGLPVQLRTGRHAEDTFRTRTFLFGCAAAVAARLSRLERIVIAENGQGSIGASLVPFGNEVPYRTTHPLFTRRLARFLATVEIPVRFEHPYAWRTKGSVLRDMLARGPAGAWQVTKSCSRNLNRTKQIVGDHACGICGNCLLRRVAVHAAGATDALSYHWSLEPSDLAAVDVADAKRKTTPHDRAIATHSVMSMDAFAKMSAQAPAIRRSIFMIAQDLSVSAATVAESHEDLRTAHAGEWASFLSSLPRHSWVHRYVASAGSQS